MFQHVAHLNLPGDTRLDDLHGRRDFRVFDVGHVGRGAGDFRLVAAEEGEKRIAKQIEPDGRLPRELERTRSRHYTLFAIDALLQVARLAEPLGVDVYHYRFADGRGLKPALDYMTPFLLGEQTWQLKELEEETLGGYAGMLHRAAKVYGEPRYEAVAMKLRGSAPAKIETLLSD